MSEFRVVVTKLEKISKHPNADSLSISNVLGYPVIFKTGNYIEGEKVVYISIDAVVPLNDSRFSFLKDARIRAIKLRGIFSMGLIIKANDEWIEEQDVRNELGITKYEPPEPINLTGENEKDNSNMPHYTDIEGFRKYSNIIKEGEEIVITEKLHGCNARFCFNNDRMWLGSHTCIKKLDGQTVWNKTATKYHLEATLKQYPKMILYGEIYGYIQDLRYNMKPGEYQLALFDILDLTKMKYLDFDNFMEFCNKTALPTVPILYKGKWKNDLINMSNGKSTIADHIREGFVVKPLKERWNEEIGRVILKYPGEDYLLRREK